MYKISPGLSSFLAFIVFIMGFSSCRNVKKVDSYNKNDNISASANDSLDSLFFNISLAEWSFHSLIHSGKMSAMDFAQRASELGFQGIEYVSTFYTPYYKDAEEPMIAFQRVIDTLKANSEKYHIDNVLIMIDAEGPLAISDDKERKQAIENHKKWVDAAAELDAHSIRVNLRGSDNSEQWKQYAVKSLTQLGKYGALKNISILVENHGGFSSDAALLTSVIKAVNMKNVGTLPDFGNFCLKGHITDCKKWYPRYKGVKLMMPYAMGVSAKSYNFDKNGNETLIDYARMLKIVQEAGYTGYIGVEYEGTGMSPEEGIIATRDLLIKTADSL